MVLLLLIIRLLRNFYKIYKVQLIGVSEKQIICNMQIIRYLLNTVSFYTKFNLNL